VTLQVLDGLQAAHAVNIVHGDLQADDIVLRTGRRQSSSDLILDWSLTLAQNDVVGLQIAVHDVDRVGGL